MKASTVKPSVKPPHRDKTLGIDQDIRSYELEDGDKTQEGEGAEILIIHNKILAATKKNLTKRNFPYIYTFDHKGPAVVRAMHDLTSGVFGQLEIT